MLFSDDRRPGVVDLQQQAFEQAMRAVRKNMADPSRTLGRVLMMFDHNGEGWGRYLSPEVTGKPAKFPKLPHLDRSYALTLMSTAHQLGVDPYIVEAIPEARLREEIRRALESEPAKTTLFKEKLIVADPDSGAEDVHDEKKQTDEDSCPFLVKCRGVSAALFKLASTAKGKQVGVIKGFFQKDGQNDRRVNLQVILDGAQFAQTHLDVGSEIRVYFYTPIPALGAVAPERIYILRDGRIDDIK
jgi:hypothetical protein